MARCQFGRHRRASINSPPISTVRERALTVGVKRHAGLRQQRASTLHAVRLPTHHTMSPLSCHSRSIQRKAQHRAPATTHCVRSPAVASLRALPKTQARRWAMLLAFSPGKADAFVFFPRKRRVVTTATLSTVPASPFRLAHTRPTEVERGSWREKREQCWDM